MKVEKYKLIYTADLIAFRFVSEGPKGSIRKLILFQKLEVPNLYNLAFGDEITNTGEIDDLIVTNNNDSEKVLATVASTLYLFFEKYPEAFVYASGSTDARTRLYRRGITKFYNEIIHDFLLQGQIENDFYDFELGKEYSGFLIQRKFF